MPEDTTPSLPGVDAETSLTVTEIPALDAARKAALDALDARDVRWPALCTPSGEVVLPEVVIPGTECHEWERGRVAAAYAAARECDAADQLADVLWDAAMHPERYVALGAYWNRTASGCAHAAARAIRAAARRRPDRG